MITIIGASGQIGHQLAQRLLQRGEAVRAIARRRDAIADLAGADLRVGDAGDVAFLTDALKGSDAVFAMIPPDYAADDHGAYQERFGQATVDAIRAAGVTKVVHLSSIGAGLSDGTGPIKGLHRQEARLNSLAGVDVLHVRPAYFLENHLHAIGLIKALGVYPGMIRADVALPMIATRDIAAAAADTLVHRTFTDKTVVHLLGQRDLTLAEVARILGAAIGKPELQYVQAPAADVKGGMVSHGFSQDTADLFEEMANAFSDGRIQRTVTRTPADTTPTAIEDFATGFAAAYAA